MSSRLSVALLLVVLTAAHAMADEVYLLDKKWGSHGSANGQFDGNIGLSIKGDRLYTAECNNARVQIFDLNGVFKGKFGVSGTGSGQLNAPRQVVLDSLLNYFVVDSENARVTRFNSAYVPMAGWGTEGTGNLNFKAPWRLAINPTTNMLYVADMNNNRISQWTTGGSFVRVWGSKGTANGQFDSPDGVAVDSAGYVYVADDANHRIQRFTATGVYVGKWTVGPATPPGSPCAIATSTSGHVFVGDVGYGTIRKYTTSGTLVTSFGSVGTGAGQFYGIDGIAVDGQGRVFVSDGNTPTCRIQRFVPDLLPTAPTTVTIGPKPPHDNDNLTASASGATDGDSATLIYKYQWYKSSNGTTWLAGPAGSTVLASATTIGQYWKVVAVAYDGKACGPWKSSVAVKIVANTLAPALSATAQQAGDGGLAVTLTLATPAAVEAQLCNLAGIVVAASPACELPGGISALLLPARSRSGARLPAGQYLLRLQARDASGTLNSTLCPLALR